MDEHAKYAFTSATDICKQFITLATGVLALEVTFLKDIATKATNGDVWLLESSWVLLAISILFGLWTLMALTGTAAQPNPPQAKSVYGANIRLPMFLQTLSFLLGMVLSMAFGMVSI